ncbi:dephospho-CoA kinase [Oxalobacteraceae bacterium CAVE-383]|nr:dephospho-CoA kinase [Oxalobacteraceae bacterium CAVE-383]
MNNKPDNEEGARPKFTVGLTGGIGSGKTTVAELFAARGAAVIDTDLIAHQLSAPGGLAIDALRRAFGASFITPQGALDRQRMRGLVFSDGDARRRLEAILHPLIKSEAEREAALAEGSYTIFVVPLLTETSSWKRRSTRILVVDCDESTQIARVMRRNQLSSEQVLAIMAAQIPRERRLAMADDIIENNGDSAELPHQVDRLHMQYLKLAE